MKKVLLVTEILNPPYDEGIKKTVYNLYNNLTKTHNVDVVCREGFANDKIHTVNANALFLSFSVFNLFRKVKPEYVIYFPFASATFAGYLRFFILSLFSFSVKPIFLALQPKPLKGWQKTFVKFIKPKMGLTPSPQLKEFWDSIGVKSQLMPLLTDLDNFQPLADSSFKRELRIKYNLPTEAYIISHMGHLNEGRNLKSLIPLQRNGNQVVVVGSSSTPLDALGTVNIKQELLNEGVIILDGYIDKIQEIYQLSDLYIFPVVAKNSSIGMPLSVLEARACSIPVVSTDFGSLQHYLGSDYNSVVYSDPTNFLNVVNNIKEQPIAEYSKSKVADINSEFYAIIDSCLK